MTWLVWCVLALAAQAPVEEAVGVTGVLSVTMIDGKGQPVPDLEAAEIEVRENGVKREVKRVARDSRPLAVAVLVDASATVGSQLRTELAGPVFTFLASLPPDTKATLLTVGTPPAVIDLADPALARQALEQKVPFGKLSLYDGIAQASRTLAETPGARRVIVTIASDLFDEQDQLLAARAVPAASPIVLALQFGSNTGYFAPGLDSIVKWSGGRYEQMGAPSGANKTLPKLRSELEPTWLVCYATPSAREARKVEVKTTRKGAKVRFRPAGL